MYNNSEIGIIVHSYLIIFVHFKVDIYKEILILLELPFWYNRSEETKLRSVWKMKISEKANELIQKLMEKHPHTLLTIGTLNKSETSYKLFDKTGEIPYESHLYEIGSIGKTFTTSLLAKYINEGKMSLDDTVAKYISELDDVQYYPSLKRLATHTAGYPEDYELQYDLRLTGKLLWKYYIKREQPIIQDNMTVNKEKLIRFAKKRKLKDEDYPWIYSNFGISLLGLALSNVAKKDFMTTMTEFIQHDLKLKNTYVGVNYDQLVQGYDLKNQEIIPWFVPKDNQFIPSGGGMLANSEDLLEYARLNLAETPEYLTIAHEYHAPRGENVSNFMGLGWWGDTQEKIFGHGGNTSGFATYLLFSKEKDFAVVILANISDYEEREPLGNAVLSENWKN